MTMMAKLVNTSNWEHEDIEVLVESGYGYKQPTRVLAPGESMDIPVAHDSSKHDGTLGRPTSIHVHQRIKQAPKPFYLNGAQVFPTVKVEASSGRPNPFHKD